jgi:hypothetical protein
MAETRQGRLRPLNAGPKPGIENINPHFIAIALHMPQRYLPFDPQEYLWHSELEMKPQYSVLK